jgi:hypothetical protein
MKRKGSIGKWGADHRLQEKGKQAGGKDESLKMHQKLVHFFLEEDSPVNSSQGKGDALERAVGIPD